MASEVSGNKVTLSMINRNNSLGKIFDCIDNNFTRLANVINSGSLNTSIEIEEFVANEYQTNFTLHDTFIPGTNALMVYVNNAIQWEGSGFFEVGNQAFRLAVPCDLGTLVKAIYIRTDPEYIKIDKVFDDDDIEDSPSSSSPGGTGVNIPATDVAKVNEAIRQIQSMMIEVQSYVHGGTGSRRGEATDNATYLFTECQRMVREIRTLRDELKNSSYSTDDGDVLVAELDATMVAYNQTTVDNALKGFETNLEALETMIKGIDSSKVKYKNTTVELKLDSIVALLTEFNRKLDSTTVPADIIESVQVLQDTVTKLQRAISGTINASAVIYDETGLTLIEELDSIERSIRTLDSKINREDSGLADDIENTNRSVERLSRSIDGLTADVDLNKKSLDKLNKTVTNILDSLDVLQGETEGNISSSKISYGNSTLNDKLAGIDSKIQSIDESISSTNLSVSSTNRRLQVTEEEIEDIKANVTTLDRKTTKSINSVSVDLDELAESIDSLDRKTTRNLSGVTAEIGTLTDTDTELTRRITTLTSRVDNLEAGTGNIQLTDTDIAVNNKTKNLAEKLSEIDTSINSISTENQTLNLKTNNILNQISNIQLNLEDKETLIDSLDRKLTRNLNAVGTDLEDLTDSISALETRTNKSTNALSTEINQLDSDIQTFKTATNRSINDLYTRIDNIGTIESGSGEGSTVTSANLTASNIKYSDSNVQSALENLETSVDSLDRRTTKSITNLTNSIETVEDNLSSSENKLTKLTNSINGLIDSLDETDTNLGTLERTFNRTVNSINADIEDYQAANSRSITSLTNRVSALESSLESGNIQIGGSSGITVSGNINAANVSYGIGSNVKSKLDSLTENLETLESNTISKFTRIQSELDSLDDSMTSLNSRTTRQVNQLSDTIEALEDSYSSFTSKINNKVNTLTDSFNECENKVNNFESKVNALTARDTLSADKVIYKENSNVQDKLDEVFSILTELTNTGGFSSSSMLDLILPKNAGSHNGVYRGNSLGSEITESQIQAIRAGTFDDMFIGDYWNIEGTEYSIAGFDLFLNSGPNSSDETINEEEVQDAESASSFDFITRFSEDTSNYKLSEHHVVLVPASVLELAAFPDTVNQTGGTITIPGGEDTEPSGDDTPTGSGGEDTVTTPGGGEGEDTINPPPDTTPSGDDTPTGSGGNDTITIEPETVVIYQGYNSGSYNFSKFNIESVTVEAGSESSYNPTLPIETIDIGGDDTLEIPDIEITIPAEHANSVNANYNSAIYNISDYNSIILSADSIEPVSQGSISSISSEYDEGIYNEAMFDLNKFAVSELDSITLNGFRKSWYSRKLVENNGKIESKWVKVNHRLLTEIAVFGTHIYGSPERSEITSQFPIFKMAPDKIISEDEQDYWLSDSINGTKNACIVTGSGEAYFAETGKLKGIRPFFLIG